MKAIKSLITITFILLISIGFAQPPNGGGRQQSSEQGPPPVPNAKQISKMVKQLAKQISLTTEQEKSVLELYTTHFETVKQKTSGNSRPKREEMEVLKTNFENEVKQLLTLEQKRKYNAYLKNQHSRNRR